jgi:hypothetical protein
MVLEAKMLVDFPAVNFGAMLVTFTETPLSLNLLLDPHHIYTFSSTDRRI